MKLTDLKNEKIRLEKEASEVESQINNLTRKIEDLEKEKRDLALKVQQSEINMKRCYEAHIKGEKDISEAEGSKSICNEYKEKLGNVDELLESAMRVRKQADMKRTQIIGTIPEIRKQIYSWVVADLKSKLKPDIVHEIYFALGRSNNNFFNYPTLLLELFPSCPDERQQEILAGLDKAYEL